MSERTSSAGSCGGHREPQPGKKQAIIESETRERDECGGLCWMRAAEHMFASLLYRDRSRLDKSKAQMLRLGIGTAVA